MGNEASSAIAMASAKSQFNGVMKDVNDALANVQKKEQPTTQKEMKARQKERQAEYEKKKQERAEKKFSISKQWAENKKSNTEVGEKKSIFGGTKWMMRMKENIGNGRERWQLYAIFETEGDVIMTFLKIT